MSRTRHRPKRMVRVELTWEDLFKLIAPMLPPDATFHSSIVKSDFERDGVERLCIKVESDKFDQVAQGTIVPLLSIDI